MTPDKQSLISNGKRLQAECGNTILNVISLANQQGLCQSNEPIKTREYTQHATEAGEGNFNSDLMTKWCEHGTTGDGTRKRQRGTGQAWDNVERNKKGTTRDETSMGQRGTKQERDNAGRDKKGNNLGRDKNPWDTAERNKKGTTRDRTSMGQLGARQEGDNAGQDKKRTTREGTGLDYPTLLN